MRGHWGGQMHRSGVKPKATRINLARDESESTMQWIRLYSSFVNGLDSSRDYAHQSLFVELLSSLYLQASLSLRSWTLHNMLTGVVSCSFPQALLFFVQHGTARRGSVGLFSSE